MRAPLISIVGFTSELEEGVQDLQKFVNGSNLTSDDPNSQKARLLTSHDMPEAIGYIRQSAAKLDALLSAVLKISREGGRVLNAEVIDLRELVSSSSAAIQHQLSEAGGQVVVDLEVSSIMSDRLSLGQVIGNLLDNAVKYRAPGRPLRIDVRSSALPSDRVALEIADNGRGIAPGDISRIFELFRRVGKIDQPGEGVGLAYVRTLVGNLGGEISGTSELDKGTIFRVVLPREFKSHFASAA